MNFSVHCIIVAMPSWCWGGGQHSYSIRTSCIHSQSLVNSVCLQITAMFTRAEWTGQRAQTCRSVSYPACGAPPNSCCHCDPPCLDRPPTHAHMMAICDFYIQRCDKHHLLFHHLSRQVCLGGMLPPLQKKTLPKNIFMSKCITDIKTFLFTPPQSRQLNLINYSSVHPPTTTSTTTPGEFLIKPPICFKLAPLTVHLCKIPGIMKDLSNGNPFGLIWLLIGEWVGPQPSVQQVALRRVPTPDPSVGCDERGNNRPWWFLKSHSAPCSLFAFLAS